MSITIQNTTAESLLSTIADNSVNLIIIDPPYIMQTDGGSKLRAKVKNWDKMHGQKENLAEGFDFGLFKEFGRVQPFLNMYIFCNVKLLQKLMTYFDSVGFDRLELLVLHKQNPLPAYNSHYLVDLEYCLFVCENKKYMFNGDYESSSKMFSYQIPYYKYTAHPTEKPLDIVERLVRNSSKEGDLVLDCFSGSGTTAHACKISNRKFIGSEINAEYYKESLQRVQSIMF